MKWASKQKGFTIVELLIVVVVIAVLAAITIVSYNGITTRAKETASRSDLANFAKKVELFSADNGRYPTSASELTTLNYSLTREHVKAVSFNAVYCYSADGSAYALQILTTSDRRLYVSGGTIQEYTGANLWTGSDNALRCSQVLSNSAGNIVGYQSSTWQGWIK